jgi:cytochrome bd-type quinol oxidase subunit 1
MFQRIKNFMLLMFFFLHDAKENAYAVLAAPNKVELLQDISAQQGTIMAIVTGAITVLLGVIIFANVKNAMPGVNDSAANTTMATVGAIFYSAVNLVVIGFLVLAAVFILFVVGRLRAGGRGG